MAYSPDDVASVVMSYIEIADEVAFSADEVVSEAMPYTDVASEVIISDDASDGALMIND